MVRQQHLIDYTRARLAATAAAWLCNREVTSRDTLHVPLAHRAGAASTVLTLTSALLHGAHVMVQAVIVRRVKL